jgi:hypothetical protein
MSSQAEHPRADAEEHGKDEDPERDGQVAGALQPQRPT